MTIAHVICANDSVEAVVLDDEVKANEEKERFAKVAFEEHQRHGGRARTEKAYRALVYWHLHSVEVIEAPAKCPFDGPHTLRPEDACPVCGDLGTFDTEVPSNCKFPVASLRPKA
jgi:hypothetical protein